MTDIKKPIPRSPEAAKEIDKLEKQFEAQEQNVATLEKERPYNHRPETQAEIKLSKNELADAKDIYLKPVRTTYGPDKFNENYREEWEFAKQYVNIIAENNEVIGESLDFWSKPFAGIPAEEWVVPVNKPVWVPRYVAEQIKRGAYRRLKSIDKPLQAEGGVTYYGALVEDTVIQRIDARPFTKQRSVFMAANF